MACKVMLQPDCFLMNMYVERARHCDCRYRIVYSEIEVCFYSRIFVVSYNPPTKKSLTGEKKKRKRGGILSHLSVAARAEPFKL